MSVQRTEITPEIDEYILNNFSAEDDFLKSLKIQAEMLKIPNIYISADQGRFLQFLIKSINAKRILEIGTLAGYSAIMMARAMDKSGKIISLESNHLHYKFAKEKIDEAGFTDNIEVVVGLAIDYLESYQSDEKFDFVFMDADKSNLINYLELCTPILKKGGIIAVDNAFAMGNLTVENPVFDEIHKHKIKDVYAVREFNQYFKNNPNYFTSLITVGDGLLLGVKQ